jgi:hypothetical protein
MPSRLPSQPSLLPEKILPQNTPLVDASGNMTRNWWLFFVNLSTSVLNPYSGGVNAEDIIANQMFARRDFD